MSFYGKTASKTRCLTTLDGAKQKPGELEAPLHVVRDLVQKVSLSTFAELKKHYEEAISLYGRGHGKLLYACEHAGIPPVYIW